jgi:hypothetical protein
LLTSLYFFEKSGFASPCCLELIPNTFFPFAVEPVSSVWRCSVPAPSQSFVAPRMADMRHRSLCGPLAAQPRQRPAGAECPSIRPRDAPDRRPAARVRCCSGKTVSPCPDRSPYGQRRTMARLSVFTAADNPGTIEFQCRQATCTFRGAGPLLRRRLGFAGRPSFRHPVPAYRISSHRKSALEIGRRFIDLRNPVHPPRNLTDARVMAGDFNGHGLGRRHD